MEGILFYKDFKNNENVRVPVEYIENCKNLLDEETRHTRNKSFDIKRNDGKADIESSGNLMPLDRYKQKTLYLLIGDKEFLVKND